MVSKSRSACLLRAARDIKDTHNVHTNDLSTGLFDLLELPGKPELTSHPMKRGIIPQKIPETGLGDNLIRGKDTHAVDFGRRFRFSGKVAADDLVFLDSHSKECVNIHHPTRVLCIHLSKLVVPRRNMDKWIQIHFL
jgi:hypothetical protein